MKNKLVKQIKEELISLGFNVNSLGVIYWTDAILYVKKNVLTWEICEIYSLIAKKRKTSSAAVERLMRYSITPAKNNIQKKYNYYFNIKISTFLKLIRFKLI